MPFAGLKAQLDRIEADVAAVEIVCEQRYEFSSEAEATVFRVRVTVPGAGHRAGELRDTVGMDGAPGPRR